MALLARNVYRIKQEGISLADTNIKINCEYCSTSFYFPEPENDLEFMEEMQIWGNPSTECPGCAAAGRQTFHAININLPESEFDEQEIDEEPFFPPGEKEKRDAIRALMFRKRPDLKGKKPAAINKAKKAAIEKKFGLPIEEVRAVYADHVQKLTGKVKNAPVKQFQADASKLPSSVNRKNDRFTI